jgi:hypothetical protein
MDIGIALYFTIRVGVDKKVAVDPAGLKLHRKPIPKVLANLGRNCPEFEQLDGATAIAAISCLEYCP